MTDIKETATAVNFTLMKLIALQNEGEQGDALRPSPGTFFSKLFIEFLLSYKIA